jgi:hypothetical protein
MVTELLSLWVECSRGKWRAAGISWDRDFQYQKARKPARPKRITVSGRAVGTG